MLWTASMVLGVRPVVWRVAGGFSTCGLCGPVTAVSVSYTQICSGRVFCRVHACFAHRILCASGAGYDIRMGKNKMYT